MTVYQEDARKDGMEDCAELFGRLAEQEQEAIRELLNCLRENLEAERHGRAEDEDEVIVLERPRGRFRRQLFLSDALDPAQAPAHFENGVLTLELPVQEQAKPRRIEIGSGDSGARSDEGGRDGGESGAAQESAQSDREEN